MSRKITEKLQLQINEIAADLPYEDTEAIQRAIVAYGFGTVRDYVASNGKLPNNWESIMAWIISRNYTS